MTFQLRKAKSKVLTVRVGGQRATPRRIELFMLSVSFSGHPHVSEFAAPSSSIITF